MSFQRELISADYWGFGLPDIAFWLNFPLSTFQVKPVEVMKSTIKGISENC